MKTTRFWVWLMLIGFVNSTHAAILVTFDQSEYVVSSVGEPFEVQVLIDADDRTPELEPIPRGLFSYGSEIIFDPLKANAAGVSEIDIVSELDNFGFSAGGFKEASAGRAAGKGNIDQNENPLEPYMGNLLMTVTLTNNAAPIDEYPLDLDFFRTLGPTEQLFVDGAGSVLDADITFGAAKVRVVPEPTVLWQFALLSILSCCSRRALMAG